MRLAAVLTIAMVCLPSRSLAQHPNDSIAPEKPKPTPYGLKISRSDDQLRPAEIDEVADLPVLAPYLETFEAAESDGGPYDFKLTEPLHDLGRAQLAAGRYGKAMAQLRRALHVTRINEGLYSPSQLPMLDDMIDAHRAMGALDEADGLYKVRYDLQKRAYPPGSPERNQATREYVEWQRQAYLQSIGGATFRRLLEMHDVHSDDIEQLEQNDPDDPALIPHLYDRLLVEYLISQYNGEKQASLQINVSGPAEMDPVMSGQLAGERFRQLREFNFRNGLRTLKRIVQIEETREKPDAMALARAKLATGDWYLWWQRSSRALQNYEQAWALLSQDGSPKTDPDALFPHPVELPDTRVFHADGIKPSEDVLARARVSMGVTRDGRAQEIEILDQQPPDDMGARVVLYRLLRQVRFRPVVRDGMAVPFAGIEREYRYQY